MNAKDEIKTQKKVKSNRALSVSNLSFQELGENAVFIRDAAKGIGRNLTIFENPKSVMIVAKQQERGLSLFTRELARNLLDTPRCKDLSPAHFKVYIEDKFKETPSFQYEKLIAKFPHYKHRLLFWTPQFCHENHDQIDILITLGGDGTVLYASWLFQNCQVPPILPFHFGSLGFLTVFKIDEVTDVLNRVLGGAKTGIRLNMRMRLSCTVWKSSEIKAKSNGRFLHHLTGLQDLDLDESKFDCESPCAPDTVKDTIPVSRYEVVNDIVIDRGPSAYMSQLELFVEDRHLTTVQADGLVISTPTGSTAYSLAAGGNLVHPEVPSILLTPICAHSLSFRPMLLPDSTELKILLPVDSRNTAWISFDGRHRMELLQGDFVVISLSRYPVPTVCKKDQSDDWFESLKRSLHWNERTRQRGFPTPPTPGAEEPEILNNAMDLASLSRDLFDI